MLEVNDINAYYGDLQALSGVSLSVKKGEIIALIGSNGAGKSTLLKAVMGLVRPSRGTISFNGLILNKKPTHEIVDAGICLIPEGKGLFPKMSVIENLEMGGFLHRTRHGKEKRIRWIYELFPILKGRRDQMAGSLSGGEQQMLAIGRGLMSSPALLLSDEVSLGLAPLLVEHLLEVIRRINIEAAVSVLIVEQNVFMVLKIARIGYLIENGCIVGHAETASLLSNDRVKQAYLGQS